MAPLSIVARRGIRGTAKWANAFGPIRLGILIALALLAALSNDAAQIMAQSLSDAFLQVTVFVAATLAIFYSLEAWYKIDVTALLARHQVWRNSAQFRRNSGAIPAQFSDAAPSLLRCVADSHGGLSFLRDSAEFLKAYVQTVTLRIM